MDKRDECGCHRECTILPHECDNPCRWPDCLSTREAIDLVRIILEEASGE